MDLLLALRGDFNGLWASTTGLLLAFRGAIRTQKNYSPLPSERIFSTASLEDLYLRISKQPEMVVQVFNPLLKLFKLTCQSPHTRHWALSISQAYLF